MATDRKDDIYLPEYTKSSFLGRFKESQLPAFRRLKSQSRAKKAFTESSTVLEHLSKKNIDVEPDVFRNTGIICTIGPASWTEECLEKLMIAGMDVARLNFSHGSHEVHERTINRVRAAAKKLNTIVAIALDTKGPEIRTGNFVNNEEVFFDVGDKVRVTTDFAWIDKGCHECFFVDYLNMPKVVKKGSIIYVDDGLLGLEVISTDKMSNIECVVINAAPISNHKGVNLPNVEVDLPALSQKDKRDLKFGVRMGVDMIFASFIRKREDVESIRDELGEQGAHIKIIAKIENHEGVQKFNRILLSCDGVMVARGDLGIEVPTEAVSVAQKMMISNCMMAGKPCIVATQMLDSMVHNPRPTRAEASDVANAVMDGADCVMLSGETAKGKYPIQAVVTMAKICRQAESVVLNYTVFNDVKQAQLGALTFGETIACSAVMASFETDAKIIIALTNGGATGRSVCKFRPSVPVVCVVGESHAATARQLSITRGAISVLYNDSNGQKSAEERIQIGVEYCQKQGLLGEDAVVVAVYSKTQGKGFPTAMKIFPVDLDE